MKRLYLLLLVISLCQGFRLHSDKTSKSKKSGAVKSHGRQYVSPAQQPAQGMNNQQVPYGAGQTTYGQQQQYGQNTQPMSKPINRGHGGTLYSHRPVPDHDKDISPPGEEKGKKNKKKFSKTKKEDDDEE